MKSTLSQLEELCMLHDWTYESSEDHSRWRKGNAEWKAIVAMQDKCRSDGYSQSEIIKVMSKYYFD